MELWQIKHLIKTIDESLEKRDEDLKNLFVDQNWNGISMSAEMQLKYQIGKVCGGVGGELLFIKSVLVKEKLRLESKKFWQFWK